MMLLNKYLQYYHFSEKHEIKISASKENIVQAIIDLHPNEISFLFSTLFFIRSIPPKILGKNYIGFSPDTPLLKQLEEKDLKYLR